MKRTSVTCRRPVLCFSKLPLLPHAQARALLRVSGRQLRVQRLPRRSWRLQPLAV